MEHVIETHDLDTYAYAHSQPKWDNSMDEEYQSLMKNKTRDLVPLLQGKNIEVLVGQQDEIHISWCY